jgi:ubiquinone/menaquinone biosynthesis C-methylase UbiE
LYTNAWNLGFPSGFFDIAISGFMGWYDCFDFGEGKFTQPDTKTKEFWRVLREGGRFVCCSWEKQEDVTWMEEQIIRYFPPILEEREYLDRRPIGMAYEKPAGYEIIFQEAGFKEIEIIREEMTFVSTDEEEWWQQMLQVGWKSFTGIIEDTKAGELQRVKAAIFKELQAFKNGNGIHFDKIAFYVRGVK